MEVFSAVVTQADGYAEREAAKAMINDARQALPSDESITITLGADKGYDAKEFIDALQQMNVRPHVAQNKSGRQSEVPDSDAKGIGCGHCAVAVASRVHLMAMLRQRSVFQACGLGLWMCALFEHCVI